jgi:hypothetical protein
MSDTVFWGVMFALSIGLAYILGRHDELGHWLTKYVPKMYDLLQENADLRCKIAKLSYADAAGEAAVEEAFRGSDS